MQSRRLFTSIVLALGFLLGGTKLAYAATFTPGCTPAELVAAVAGTQANAEDDTITLASGCTYALSAVKDTSHGDTGLASLTKNKVLLHGNGATITRASGAPAFRFLIVDGAALEVDHLTLRGGLGASGFDGGSVRVQSGSLVFADSLVDQGATQGFAYGGAIAMFGTPGAVTVQRSTFTNNTAVNGGAISLDGNTAVATIVDSTFTANHATTNGGAINATTEGGSGSVMTIAFCTIIGNRADNTGGGIHQDAQIVHVSNSIVAKNNKNGNATDAAADVNGTFVNDGFNLVGIGAGVLTSGGTTKAGTTAAPLDPLVGPLASNTGPQQTIALLDGSPALDAGSASVAASLAGNLDERGYSRTASTPDIGAFEKAAALLVSPSSVNVAANGSVVFTAFGGTGFYTFSLSAAPSGGTLAGNGTYTAGANAGDDTITLSDGISTTSAIAHVTTAPPPPPVVLVPGNANTAPGGFVAFSASGGVPPLVFDIAANLSGGVVDANGNYRAGRRASVTDVIRVTDAQGTNAVATVVVGAAVTVTPATSAVAPLGAVTFAAAGGQGPYHWSLATNASGGSLSSAGAYLAGSTKMVTDVVLVTDSLGNTARADVVVGGGIAINPPTATVAPLGTIAFTASGGSGSGFRFALALNGSGGSIDGAGSYVAGAVGGVSDVIQVRDDNGNSASVEVMVGPALSVTPATSTVAAGTPVAFTLTGGSGGGYTVTIVTNSSGGTIGEHGVYTAGPNAGTDVITITDGNGAKVTVTVNVTAAPATTTPPPATTTTAPASDAGTPPTGDHGTTTPTATTDVGGQGGCATTAGPTSPGTALALLFGLALAGARRRRR